MYPLGGTIFEFHRLFRMLFIYIGDYCIAIEVFWRRIIVHEIDTMLIFLRH